MSVGGAEVWVMLMVWTNSGRKVGRITGGLSLRARIDGGFCKVCQGDSSDLDAGIEKCDRRWDTMFGWHVMMRPSICDQPSCPMTASRDTLASLLLGYPNPKL